MRLADEDVAKLFHRSLGYRAESIAFVLWVWKVRWESRPVNDVNIVRQCLVQALNEWII
jgi:hypothetical protein